MKSIAKNYLVASLLLSLLIGGNFFVKAEVSQSTIDYLLNQPQDQWLTMALAANQQTNLDLSYLANFGGSTANEYSKTILALVASGNNPSNYQNIDYLQGLRNFYQADQFGLETLVSDDFWALIALRSAGVAVEDEQLQHSKQFILDQQNADGGWSYAPGAISDTNDTAAAIMALLDVGLTNSSSQIQTAISYLHSQQNADGGFPYLIGSPSDAGSDAWVISAIYKLGEDPQTWLQGQSTPVSHLQSLMLTDGSFKWLASDIQGHPLMTAYAAIALNSKFYPVAYWQNQTETSLHHLRIEGANQTYCDALVEATNALAIVQAGAEVCGYTYQIEQTSFGPYLAAINNESANGASGWLYWVNWFSPNVGANDYQLTEGDRVLWAFGQWGNFPLKISLSATITEPNQPVLVTVEYFNGASWLPANQATVHAGDQLYQSDVSGQATIDFSQSGSYQLYAEKDNYIRSPRLAVAVGNGSFQAVDLQVNIDGASGGDNLSFSVNPASLNFGSLAAGQTASQNTVVTNTGSVSFHLEAGVNGDAVFQDNTYLNNDQWEDYQDQYGLSEAKTVAVDLRLPADYQGSGQRQGSLIFWATRN